MQIKAKESLDHQWYSCVVVNLHLKLPLCPRGRVCWVAAFPGKTMKRLFGRPQFALSVHVIFSYDCINSVLPKKKKKQEQQGANLHEDKEIVSRHPKMVPCKRLR